MIKQVFFSGLIIFLNGKCGVLFGQRFAGGIRRLRKNKSGEATVAEALNGGMFMGYVAGVFDTYSMQGNRNICPEAGISIGVAADAVMQYLNAHPEQLHYSAPSVIMLALTAAYPCVRH